jgi:carboxyl-terminal processing protease
MDMKNKLLLYGLLLITIVLATPLLSSSTDELADDLALAPSIKQSKTLESVFSRLQRLHYRKLTIDDRLSEHLLDQYLIYLDPARVYLLAEDVEAFETYRHTLDDALKSGDLEPAYTIFRRFQERRLDRTEYLIKALENNLADLDFTVDERLELDRKEAPWLKRGAEWDELWRKYFKNDVLNLRLLEKTEEEIEDLLGRRYRNRLLRMKQINADDVFRTYMGVFTQRYDPHTEYFPPRRAENFDINMRLSYEGIGALLSGDGEYISIARIIPGGPAEKNGELKAGDRIVGVAQADDGEVVDVIGWRTDEVVELIRGEKGTVVRLSILPANLPDSGATKVITLTRNEVKLEEQAASKKTVEVEREGAVMKIGIVELPAFYIDFEAARRGDPDYKSGTRDVARLVKELKEEGMDGIVLDLRNNAGGSLIEAAELTSLFLDGGPVVQIRDVDLRVQVMPSARDDTVYTGPVALLVNRISASASEIAAAAIQDHGRGLVLGGRTFGKGTVQRLMPLGDGQLKITKAKFYRISGGSTQHKGVEPDIHFPAVYDNEEIGESALDEALPWDRIAPLRYRKDTDVEAALPELKRLHRVRASNDPDFVRFTEQLAYFREAREQTLVSLNEEVRKKERAAMEAELLAIENRRRAAKGMEPLDNMDDLAEEEEEENEVDAYAREAANILSDFVRLSKR